MRNTCTRKKAQQRFLLSSITIALSIPIYAHAQDPVDIEEVVVTGSYIRNSKFNGASPVDTINQEALINHGAANIGQFVRDLTYTQNVDTVANVLGGSGGGQDSNAAQFNLRGLGTSSTLTLFDGRRNVNPGAISAILPDIATSRVEVVLDGGSALYGSDAVAGVVNIIPIKQYDGFRVRTFYNRDQSADFEEPKVGVLYGTSIDSLNLELVAAFEAGKKTPLMRGEREKYLRVDNATFIGAPGLWLTPTGAPYRDPDCGTYNGNNTDRGKDGSFPSGFLLGNNCGFHYAQWTDYNRAANDLNFYLNLTHDTTDWLSLEFQSTTSYRESIFHTEPLSPLNAGWYPRLAIPAHHPANPTGLVLTPTANWTMINGLEEGPGAKPSYLGNDSFQRDRYGYLTKTNKVGARYDIGDTTWVGETWVSVQSTLNRIESWELNAVRLEAALNGRGGPNGNEWLNPFASRDINSPSYVQGVTNNSQETMDWLFERGNTVRDERRLRLFDSFVTGEIVSLPAGMLAGAFGLQLREHRYITRPDPLSGAGMNASTGSGVVAPISEVDSGKSAVRAVFGELEVPILESLSMQLAVRYEEFTDLNLDTTTPKVALRWQPLDSLSVRASWGESFLAPTASQVGPVTLDSCVVSRTGRDPLTGANLLGTLSCLTKSPDVQPETSEIRNIGFTWEGIENLSISLDYQEIRYEDRIVTLESQDIVNQQYFSALNALGITSADYDPTPGSPTRMQALAYVAANPSSTVERATDGSLLQVLRIPANINSNLVDVLDFRLQYAMDAARLGRFTLGLDAAYYLRYEYSGFDGVLYDGRGKRNADTATAPPLPKLKSTLRLGWSRDNHSASVLTKYTDAVTFDGVFAAGTTPREVIDASYIVNVNYNYHFSDLFGSATTLTVGSNNVFDWEPRRLPVTGGFESRLYDNFGRQLFISLDIEL